MLRTWAGGSGRALERGIEREPQFAQHLELGTEAGGDHQLVGRDMTAAAGGTGGEAQAAVRLRYFGEAEAGLDLDAAAGNEGCERRAQGAACGELVVGAAAERLLGLVAA